MNDQKLHILKEAPLAERLALIHSAFNYNSEDSFAIDFLPLFNSAYKSSFYAAYSDNNLVGHIAYSKREVLIANKSYDITFIGAIAVAKEYRGQGIFQKLFTLALDELQTSTDIFMLWSGEPKLYEKYGFSECGHVYQWGELEYSTDLKETAHISDDDLEQIKELYKQTWPNRVIRTDEQWAQLRHMHSVKVFLIKKDDRVHHYGLIGKGADLSGIIHEYGSREIESFRTQFSKMKVWSPVSNHHASEIKLWLGMARPGGKWNQSVSVVNFLNQHNIMIGGIDSI